MRTLLVVPHRKTLGPTLVAVLLLHVLVVVFNAHAQVIDVPADAVEACIASGCELVVLLALVLNAVVVESVLEWE